jgi:hypothetical protein
MATNTNAQKTFSDQNHAWISYLGNHKISNKLGIHTEYQCRREDGFQNWQQSLMRVGFDYNVNPSLSITAGYGWIITFPYGDQPIYHDFNEHRIWQQVNMKNKIESKWRTIDVQHRYRLEQRFMENYIKNAFGDVAKTDNIFRQRFRYRAMVLIPLNKKTMQDNTLFLNVNDEIFLGFGKGIAKNVLDQNRFNVALGWRFNSNFNVQIGYLNQYLIKSDGIKVERNHTFLTGLTYNFDFSKKNK